jgi:dipeptidyl aminopeptidase/acylaminoacyl peptidase
MLALVAAVAIVTRWISRRVEAPEFPTFERITFIDGAIGPARFTPEGRVVFSAAFEGRPEGVYAHASGTTELQALGLPPARLAAVSPKIGELAVLLTSGRYALIYPSGTLARVPAVGGVPRELAEDVAWAEWTGSGELAVARTGGPGGGTWIERPLGNKVWEGKGHIHDLRCSPDGDRLAFIHHSGEPGSLIVVLDRRNTAHILVRISEEGVAYSLAWRPDGQHLRFTISGRSGTMLSEVSLQGHVRPLHQFPGSALLQDIAPDGKMLLSFVERRKHIAIMRPGQATRRELTGLSNPGIADLSPDGRTLLFGDGELWGINTPGHTHAVLAATDGTPPKVLGPGIPLALSPDGRTVAMTSQDLLRLFLVPTGAGRTQEVPLSGLVVGTGNGAGNGQWSRDGHRLWIEVRQTDRAEFRLFPVDVASRRLLEPIAGSDVLDEPMLISPDDRWIAAIGADSVVTVYPLSKGEPIRISSLQREPRPFPAGWTSSGALWVGLPGATPRLVKLELPTGKVIRSVDIDLHEVGGDIEDARIVPDESVIAVQYSVWRGRLELMTGIPADR